MEKKPTLMQKLSFVFAPKENKGTGWFDRAITTFVLGAGDAWAARADDPQEKRLLDSLARLSEKMQVKKPHKLIIYKSDKPNAAKLLGGTIVVGTDLMRIMNDEQMDAILGHELSHYKHGWKDFGICLGIAAAAGSVVGAGLNKLNRKMHKTGGVSEFLIEMSAADLATLPYRRYMEYTADKEGAEMASPEAMTGGLDALEKRCEELRTEAYRKKHGKNADPKDASWLEKSWRGFSRALDAHPLMKDRIAVLEKMKHGERPENNHPLQTQR